MRIDNGRDLRRLILEVLAARSGHVTLAANAASTTLRDPRLAHNSAVILIPTTASAAAEQGNGTLFIPEKGRKNGEVTIHHANTAQADRIYRYFIA